MTDITSTLPFTFLLTAQYFRVKYVNGAVAQTTFRLSVKYLNGSPGSISVNDADTFNKVVDSQLVQNISDHNLDIARSKFSYMSIVHKFGARQGVSSSSAYKPLTTNEIYQTPQVSGAVALRVKAGNTNDTANGSGAREVTIQGLDETGALVTEALATAGTSASAATSTTWLRVFRAYVSASGTYATSAAGSHAADIILETAAAAEWVKILVAGFPRAQSQIGVYSVPLGKTAYIQSYLLTVSGAKPVDFILFQRQNILETAAPYTAMRTVVEHRGIQTATGFKPDVPFGPFPALTDIGWMAKGATTPDVTVDYEILLLS